MSESDFAPLREVMCQRAEYLTDLDRRLAQLRAWITELRGDHGQGQADVAEELS